MAGQKRTRSGDLKPRKEAPSQQPQDIPMTDTPPCGQAQAIPTTAPKQPKVPRTKARPDNTFNPKFHKIAHRSTTTAPAAAAAQAKTNKSKPNTKQKRPPLPANAKISKRPLLHPSIPSATASSASPKILYITARSPFIPACKRVRTLLSGIAARDAQSAATARGGSRRGNARALQANGRLEARDVEAGIVNAAAAGKGKMGKGEGEQVYLKATGRAIPRALELGNKFQGEEDCVVRVEMGSVRAIDDVEVVDDEGAEEAGNDEEEDVPETRIRTLSTVTVCIGLK